MTDIADDELGPPEGDAGDVDMTRQINHLIASFNDNVAQLHWKVAQHAAEIDTLRHRNAELESQNEAFNQALQSESDHNSKLEGLLEREAGVPVATLTGDHQRVDGFLAAVSGQPGLGGDER
jgi:hypothetical protein